MKKCEKCGKEIVNGVNGCQLMKICFECNGGFPDYPKYSYASAERPSWDELDAAEDKCLGDIAE